MTNRAVTVSRNGVDDPLEAIELVYREKPVASPFHVVVNLKVRPIHPTDLLGIPLWRQFETQDVTLGSEGYGIVDQVGQGVTKFMPGQRVVPLTFSYHYRGPIIRGSWQDYVEVLEEDVVAMPDTISDDVAAQFFVNTWTPYGMLKDLNIPKGKYLIQTAAASVLGRQMIQLAGHWGIKTINVVRRDDVRDELKALGAEYVINSTTEDVFERVKEITGGELAYAGIDAVAGVSTKQVAACVRSGGQVFVYGRLSADDVIVAISDLMRNVNVKFWFVSDYKDDLDKRQQTAQEVLDLLEKGVIKPLIGKKFPLENFKEAVVEASKEARGGKVLLVS